MLERPSFNLWFRLTLAFVLAMLVSSGIPEVEVAFDNDRSDDCPGEIRLARS
jgi:hypothetical protein